MKELKELDAMAATSDTPPEEWAFRIDLLRLAEGLANSSGAHEPDWRAARAQNLPSLEPERAEGD
jgi:hypothetical protein